MTEPGLKISASSVNRASPARGGNSDTLARLQALDKNGGEFGNFQLDLDEVCDAIDEIVRKEKTERTLKWLLAALAVFSLLTIAATVGLTYAVVVMSQDTQVDGSVLQSKDSGETLRTGSFLQSQNATALTAAVAASNDPSAVLGRITSIKVPSLKEGEAYTVHKVDAVTMLRNQSVIVRTASGANFTMAVDSLVGPAPTAADTQDVQASGRKILQASTTYTINVEQGPATYGRSYTFSGFTGINTIADVIAKFGETTAVGPNDPVKEVIRLQTSSGVLATGTKLEDVPGLLTATAPTLYMEVRKLTIQFRTERYGGETRDDNPLYVPVTDTWGNFKREVEAKYGYSPDDQTYVGTEYDETAYDARPARPVAKWAVDENAVGDACPETWDCAVSIILSPYVQI